MDFTNRYKKISKNRFGNKPKKVKAFIPNPNERDYLRGYVQRYFVRISNDESSPIIEVDSNEYSNLLSNPFYIGEKLRWRITGNENEVKESNTKSIMLSSTKIKNLKLYLPNLLQFHK